ncbi:MAG: phosphoglycolate phosphatase [Cocleimonas sp.]|jgi:phosphoglycolate phosphatase
MINSHTNQITPELILIDLDGTLMDSIPDISWCLDQTMKQIGLPARGEAAAREWIGNGIIKIVQQAISNNIDERHNPNDTHNDLLFEEAMPIFRELYAENTSKRSSIYPGVREGLDYIQKLKSTRGLKVGCITNKDQQFTDTILRNLGLWDDFDIIISGDTLPKKKPDPLPLLHAAKELNCNPKKSLMLGDSISDVNAARVAKLSVICLSYGYNHGKDIRDSQPDVVIDSMLELKALIN